MRLHYNISGKMRYNSEMPNSFEDFSALTALDTPTVCNALEIVLGEQRDFGFTRQTMIGAPGTISAFAGRAATATIRAARRAGKTSPNLEKRMEYYRLACVPGAVAVIQDLDNPPGLGAFWGEIHSAVHAALGAAGVVTSGSVRDLDMLDSRLPILAGSVTPSHALVDVEETGGAVDIFGMAVNLGDIVHADRHGAVVIPENAAARIPEAAELVVRREKEVLDAARRGDFSVERLAEALARGREIH